jgi:hypothetical protein
MRKPAIATALAVLITAASAADAKDRRYRYYLDGHLVKAWSYYPYHLDGHLVKTLTEGDVDLEIRLVPGWQLDPTCPPSKWGEGHCAGGQGYFLFEGRWNNGILSGTARLDRDGCDEPYQVSGGRTKDGGLVLYPIDDAGKRVVNSKCKAIFKLARPSNVRRP